MDFWPRSDVSTLLPEEPITTTITPITMIGLVEHNQIFASVHNMCEALINEIVANEA